MSLVEDALRRLQDATVVAKQGGSLRSEAEIATKASNSSIPRVVASTVSRPTAPHTPIVSINAAALRAHGLLPPEHEERQVAQQYRRIKRPLVVNAMGHGTQRVHHGHLIMLVSAEPGEGKNFTAINLALSMSIEKDVHVLLVDADVAKPHISTVLGVAHATGLLDVLRDPGLDVESVILPTDVPNLSLLPAGTPSVEATELLASARMEQVMRAIGQHDPRRVVLFDSPPLLHTTESLALTQVAGQVVVVVRAGVTVQQVVLDALSYVAEHPAVSLVLNQSVRASREGYYNYGYGDGRTGQSDT
jgi:protein-tyrosine kinase